MSMAIKVIMVAVVIIAAVVVISFSSDIAVEVDRRNNAQKNVQSDMEKSFNRLVSMCEECFSDKNAYPNYQQAFLERMAKLKGKGEGR
jgi:hypothetical protein